LSPCGLFPFFSVTTVFFPLRASYLLGCLAGRFRFRNVFEKCEAPPFFFYYPVLLFSSLFLQHSQLPFSSRLSPCPAPRPQGVRYRHSSPNGSSALKPPSSLAIPRIHSPHRITFHLYAFPLPPPPPTEITEHLFPHLSTCPLRVFPPEPLPSFFPPHRAFFFFSLFAETVAVPGQARSHSRPDLRLHTPLPPFFVRSASPRSPLSIRTRQKHIWPARSDPKRALPTPRVFLFLSVFTSPPTFLSYGPLKTFARARLISCPS